MQAYKIACEECGCRPNDAFNRALASRARVFRFQQCQASDLIPIAQALPESNIICLQLKDVKGTHIEWTRTLGGITCASLRTVIVQQCDLTSIDQAWLAQCIGDLRVERIELTRNGLNDKFAEALSKTPLLGPSSTCHALVLGNNHITDAGLCKLCKVLTDTGEKHPLRTLSVAYNCITDDGAQAVASMLETGSSVEILNLEGNMIGSGGARSLAAAIPTAPVSSLQISYNATGMADLACWTNAMQSPWLEVLEVAQLKTQPSEAHVTALLLAAASSTSLTDLDVRGCPLVGAALDAACHLVRTSLSLRTLRATPATPPARDALLAAALEAARTVCVHAALTPSAACGASSRRSSMPTACSARLEHAPVLHPGVPIHGQQPPSAGASVPGTQQDKGQSCDLDKPFDARTGYAHAAVSRRARSSSAAAPAMGQSRLQPLQLGASTTPSIKPRVSTLPTGTSRAAHTGSNATDSKMPGHGRAPLEGLCAGASADRAALAFMHANSAGETAVSTTALARALSELGLLPEVPVKQVAAALTREAKLSHASGAAAPAPDTAARNTSNAPLHETRLAFPDFLASFLRLECWLSRTRRGARIAARAALPRPPPAWHTDPALRKAFRAFAAFGRARVHGAGPPARVLSSQQWAKMLCDAALLEPMGPVPPYVVDTAFVAVAKGPQGRAGLSFGGFLQALACVAARSGVPSESVTKALGAGRHPAGARNIARAVIGDVDAGCSSSANNTDDGSSDASSGGGSSDGMGSVTNGSSCIAADHGSPRRSADPERTAPCDEDRSCAGPVPGQPRWHYHGGRDDERGATQALHPGSLEALAATAQATQNGTSSAASPPCSRDANATLVHALQCQAAQIAALQDRIAELEEVRTAESSDAGVSAAAAATRAAEAAATRAACEAVEGHMAAVAADRESARTEELTAARGVAREAAEAAVAAARSEWGKVLEEERVRGRAAAAAAADVLRRDMEAQLDEARRSAARTAATVVGTESARLDAKWKGRQKQLEGAILKVAEQIDALESTREGQATWHNPFSGPLGRDPSPSRLAAALP